MQEELTSEDFAEWIAYDRLEPIGQAPIEHMLAELCALTFNIHKREEVEPLTPEDFKMRWRDQAEAEEEEPSLEEQDAAVHAFFAKHRAGQV